MIPFNFANFKKKHKYNATRTEVDGIEFMSAKEAKVYQQLKLCEKAGAIKNLRLQVRYDLSIPTKYIADFVYIDDRGREIVADAKGCKTPEYKRKKKYMELQHGIKIVEM
jgi:hypothetical protein